MIRRCRTGYKIVPLFANTKEIARKPLITFINSVDPDELFYLDEPDQNKETTELTNELRLKKVPGTTHRHLKAFPVMNRETFSG